MSPAFVRRVVGREGLLSPRDVLSLLDQDAFRETYIQRSRILDFLIQHGARHDESGSVEPNPDDWKTAMGSHG